MKTMNILFLIFLILGSLIAFTTSSRLRKHERDYESFIEEAEEDESNSNEEADEEAENWRSGYARPMHTFIF